jgi:hypothetical protein
VMADVSEHESGYGTLINGQGACAEPASQCSYDLVLQNSDSLPLLKYITTKPVVPLLGPFANAGGWGSTWYSHLCSH